MSPMTMHQEKAGKPSERIYRSKKELEKRTSFYDSLWVRHMTAYRFAVRYVRNKTVLDVGCGSGYGAFFLSKSANHVIGIDISKEAIGYSKMNYCTNDLQWMVMDALNLGFKDNCFDVLVSLQIIEHIRCIERFLSEVCRVSETFIVSTPNKKKYDKGNPFHVSEFCLADLRSLFQRHFSKVRMFGIYPNAEFNGLSKKVVRTESRIDQLHLRPIISLVPDRLKKTLSAYVARIDIEAFSVQNASEECLDFVAVCTK